MKIQTQTHLLVVKENQNGLFAKPQAMLVHFKASEVTSAKRMHCWHEAFGSPPCLNTISQFFKSHCF